MRPLMFRWKAQIRGLLFVLWSILACVSPSLADTSKFHRFKGGVPEFHGNDKIASSLIVKHRKGYSIGFSPLLHQSLWVAYRLTPKDVTQGGGRIGAFRRDEDLSQTLPPALYSGTGYDRGHLAPSIDMRYNEVVSRQSFWMGNISPQKARLNRGQWKSLERKIHNLASSASTEVARAREVYVITGPLFTKKQLKAACRSPTLDEKKAKADGNTFAGLASIVPYAFYKVYLYNGVVHAEIYQQIEKDSTQNVERHFSVSLKTLEKHTGITFFPQMSPGLRQFYFNQCHSTQFDKEE